jgi:metallophosphoesterase superfamily enzyme
LHIVTKIPDELTAVLRERKEYGRIQLAQVLNVDDATARYYCKLIREGRPIFDTHIETVPDPKSLKTALIIADLHAPYHDSTAIDVMLNYATRYRIDVLIILGDGVDFESVSFWRKDPMRVGLGREIRKAKKVIKKISDAFPDAEKIYVEGNHEDRLRAYIWDKAPALADLNCLNVKTILGLHEMGFKYISNIDNIQNGLPPLQLGKLNLFHGHNRECRKIGSSAINVAKLFYERHHVNAMIAHFHCRQYFEQRKITGDKEACWTLPCLCNLTPDFAPVNSWSQGFAIVKVDTDGNFTVKVKVSKMGE